MADIKKIVDERHNKNADDELILFAGDFNISSKFGERDEGFDTGDADIEKEAPELY